MTTTSKKKTRRPCAFCGDIFTPKRANTRFCCTSHADKARRLEQGLPIRNESAKTIAKRRKALETKAGRGSRAIDVAISTPTEKAQIARRHHPTRTPKCNSEDQAKSTAYQAPQSATPSPTRRWPIVRPAYRDKSSGKQYPWPKAEPWPTEAIDPAAYDRRLKNGVHPNVAGAGPAGADEGAAGVPGVVIRGRTYEWRCGLKRFPTNSRPSHERPYGPFDSRDEWLAWAEETAPSHRRPVKEQPATAEVA